MLGCGLVSRVWCSRCKDLVFKAQGSVKVRSSGSGVWDESDPEEERKLRCYVLECRLVSRVWCSRFEFWGLEFGMKASLGLGEFGMTPLEERGEDLDDVLPHHERLHHCHLLKPRVEWYKSL